MHASWALARIGISNNSRSFAIKSASIMPAATVLVDTSVAADGLLPGIIALAWKSSGNCAHHPGKLLELELLFLAVLFATKGVFTKLCRPHRPPCRPEDPTCRHCKRIPSCLAASCTNCTGLSARICLFPSKAETTSVSIFLEAAPFLAVIIHHSKCWDFWGGSCF